MANAKKPVRKKATKKKNWMKQNVETEKFKIQGVADTSQLSQQCGVPQGKMYGGRHSRPRMFFDANGQLHIVLYGGDEDGEVGKHILDPASPPHNKNKGFADGKGIYIHVSRSSPVDKVCPCKLLPNDPCNPG